MGSHDRGFIRSIDFPSSNALPICPHVSFIILECSRLLDDDHDKAATFTREMLTVLSACVANHLWIPRSLRYYSRFTAPSSGGLI